MQFPSSNVFQAYYAMIHSNWALREMERHSLTGLGKRDFGRVKDPVATNLYVLLTTNTVLSSIRSGSPLSLRRLSFSIARSRIALQISFAGSSLCS